MRPKDYRLFIDDIRKSCEPVFRYTSGFTQEQFLVVAHKSLKANTRFAPYKRFP